MHSEWNLPGLNYGDSFGVSISAISLARVLKFLSESGYGLVESRLCSSFSQIGDIESVNSFARSNQSGTPDLIGYNGDRPGRRSS